MKNDLYSNFYRCVSWKEKTSVGVRRQVGNIVLTLQQHFVFLFFIFFEMIWPFIGLNYLLCSIKESSFSQVNLC